MGEDLYAIIRLKEWEVDEKRRALGELFRQEEEIIQIIKDLEAELLREQELAASNVAFAFTYGEYAKKYIKRREKMEMLLNLTRRKIIEAQDDLADSFQELKTYEISQENREKRREEEFKRKEQIILDEIGSNLHRRRKQEEVERLQEELSPPEGEG